MAPFPGLPPGLLPMAVKETAFNLNLTSQINKMRMKVTATHLDFYEQCQCDIHKKQQLMGDTPLKIDLKRLKMEQLLVCM